MKPKISGVITHQEYSLSFSEIKNGKINTAITVCSYCPNKVEIETKALIDGLLMSHGACTPCYKEQMRLVGKS